MSRPPRKKNGNQKEIPPRKKMLTPKEVAERLDITEDALAMRRQRKQGPPCIYLSKRRPRYLPDEYDSWVELLKRKR